MKATLSLLLMLSGLLCFGQNQFEWIYPKPGDGIYENSGNYLDIKLKVFNPPYDAKYDVLVNGKSIYKNTKAETVSLNTGHLNAKVPLKDGGKSIVVTMTINNTTYRSKSLTVINKASPLPRLYLLSVGATPPDIDYTEEDAEDIYNIFTSQRCGTNGLYSNIIAEKIVGDEAKASDILASIQDMTRGKDMLPTDVFVLYISSHGRNINNRFHIQGSDYTNKVPDKTTVAADEIYNVLDEISAKKLVFFDACESGNGAGVKGNISIQDYRNYIINARTGYNVITSSRGAQKSYYHPNWKNGAFTEALLEGLKGKANYNNDEVITTNEIFRYLTKRVPIICREVETISTQNPDTVKYQLGDFPFFDGLCSQDIPDNRVTVNGMSEKPTRGFGSYVFENGDGYKGNWKDRQMNGEGTYFYQKTGEEYVGTWKNGNRSGEGQLFNAEGNLLYDGNWKNNMRNGKGIYFYDNGSRYIGDWKNNQKHGTGKYTVPDEGYYEGRFKKGKFHGNGIFYYKDGSHYEGSWKNGKRRIKLFG